MYLVVLKQSFVLFVPIIIGWILRKRNMVDEGFSKSLSAVLFNITLPCSILTAMEFDFSKETLFESGILILAGALMVLFSCLLGIFCGRFLGKKRAIDNVISFALTFPNFSFMGYPIVETVCGAKGLFYAAVFTIPIFVFVNSLGIILLSRSDSGGAKLKLSGIINLPLIATVVGFVMFVFSLKLPSVLHSIVSMFSAANTPMAMMMAGLVLAKAPVLSVFKNYRHYVVCFLRLIAVPLMFFVLLKLCGFSGLLLAVPVTIFSMPVASNLVLLSEKLGNDSTYAGQTVLITSLFSIFTIPLIQLIIGA